MSNKSIFNFMESRYRTHASGKTAVSLNCGRCLAYSNSMGSALSAYRPIGVKPAPPQEAVQ